MAITVICKCGKSYQVKDQFAGQETNCPYCGKPLKIPSREKAKEIPNSPTSITSPPSPNEQETVQPTVFEKIQPEVPSAPKQEQAKFAGSEDKEICAECGRQMLGSEQACIFEGNIVCAQCDNKLRSKPDVPIQQPVNASCSSFEKKQKQDNQTTAKISILGIIVSVFLIFIAFLPEINKLFEEAPLEPLNRPTISYNQEVGSSQTLYLLIWIGAGLFLFIRSLLPGLGFLRGCLTVIGAFFTCLGFSLVLFILSKHGFPSNFRASGALAGLLFGFFLGVIILIYGFRPKKGFRKKQRNTQSLKW